MLIFLNAAYDRVVSLINQADAKWQWDDDNESDLPNAVAALASGQQDYSLSTTHLSIDRVEIKDSSGNWHFLSQIDRSEIKVALAEYQKNNGIPNEYDIVGSSIFLYPAPNFTQASSLKVYFTRGGALFTAAEVTAGTKSPGFVSLFHDLIPLWVSYNYAIVKLPKIAPGLLIEIQRKESELVAFYGERNRDKRPRFTVSTSATVGSESGRITGGRNDSNR